MGKAICRSLGAWRLAWILLGLLGGMGCSQKELEEMVQKGKQQVDKASQSVSDASQNVSQAAKQVAGQAAHTGEQAKQKLGQAGDMQLRLDAPVTTSGCYAKYVPPLAGRPGILQLRSYADPAAESFPSVLLRLTATAENTAGLREQNLTGQLFVQAVKDGPVWQSDATGPVQVKVTQADDQALVAEIVGGALRSFPDGKSVVVQGRVQAVWQ